MTAIPPQNQAGSTSKPTLKTCTDCGRTHDAVLQTVGGQTLIVGSCPICFPATPKFEADTTEVTKPCADCGQDYTTAAMVVLGRTIDLGKFCEACTAKQQHAAANTKQAAFIAAREAEWKAACPEFYRTDEIVKAMPADRSAAVRAAIKDGKGCLISGPSGSFKTTAMFHGAVKRLIWEKATVRIINAMEWQAASSKAASEVRTEAWLRPFVHADWLFLDDIGNMGATASAVTALQDVLEKRMARRKPLLATTQYTGEALLQKLGKNSSVEQASAIVRRLTLTTHTSLKFTAINP